MPIAGQDRISEWQDSASHHDAGQGSLHSLDRYLSAVMPIAGQDSLSEWQDSAVRDQAGQGSLHSLDRHLSAAVCCLGSAGPQPAACG